MKIQIVTVVLLAARFASAGVPKLEKVDTEGPLKLSAPVGWEVHTTVPDHKDLATIAGISANCQEEVSVTIQLDQNMTKTSQLLDDQYHGKKPKKLHGWDCVIDQPHHEVMCAGKLKGLAGIVDVYFATIDAKAFDRFGDPGEFTSQIAATLSWSGKVSDLTEWRRPATEAAAAACK